MRLVVIFLLVLLLLVLVDSCSAPTPPVGCRNAAAVECGKRP